jgi:hypothetical protein
MEYTFEIITQSKQVAEHIRALGDVEKVVVTETTADTKEKPAQTKPEAEKTSEGKTLEEIVLAGSQKSLPLRALGKVLGKTRKP